MRPKIIKNSLAISVNEHRRTRHSLCLQSLDTSVLTLERSTISRLRIREHSRSLPDFFSHRKLSNPKAHQQMPSPETTAGRRVFPSAVELAPGLRIIPFYGRTINE
jgi:hypothetical protein